MRPVLTVSQRSPQPLYPTRIANILGRLKGRTPLEPRALMDAAARATQLSDWGDGPFQEGLDAFCRGINEDEKIHHMGRLLTKRGIEKWLTDRLEIQQLVSSEPGITQRPVEVPVVIPGFPRSGTTFLHRLMAVDPQFRTTQAWETYFPVPPPDPRTYHEDPRIQMTEKLYEMTFRTCPALATTHPMDATWVEECWPLVDRTFIRQLLCIFYDCPSYRQWVLARTHEEMVEAYRYHRKLIQVLQWRFPGARWLLKAPIHGGWLGPFDEVYPDATYIFCHRDPVSVIPSICSLFTSRRAAYYSRIDLSQLGLDGIEYVAELTHRALDAREGLGPGRCIDVSFRELMKDPIGIVKEIYRKLGVALSEDAETAMTMFLSAQTRGKHLKHRYTLDQFRLNREYVEKKFERVIVEFGEFH